jgi:hypothetical protein
MRDGERRADGEQRDCAPHGQITSRKHGDSSAVKIVAEGSPAPSAQAEFTAKEN